MKPQTGAPAGGPLLTAVRPEEHAEDEHESTPPPAPGGGADRATLFTPRARGTPRPPLCHAA